MATLNKAINKNFLENVLPSFGTPRTPMPVWDEGQKMFIYDQYESAAGHRYYKGIRFCNNIAVVEKVWLYYTCTYIDSIEVYAFNEKKLELVQKRDYTKVFRNEYFVRSETIAMLCDYLNGVLKMSGAIICDNDIEEQAKNLVDNCYKSFLDSDYAVRLTKVLPQIEK